ncbi:MAG: type II toxin-antitoxin system PemK/MazF family toxin [bacterium]|nr:type II toxin-antitoxin system PemK/MazF family toxin [bacterium]
MQKGNIVIVPFPFTDLSTTKVRPALVIVDQFGQDVLLCPISSQHTLKSHERVLQKMDYIGPPLPISSGVKFRHLFSLHAALILKKHSAITSQTMKEITNQIVAFLRK